MRFGSVILLVGMPYRKGPITRRLMHTCTIQLLILLSFVGAEPVDWSRVPGKKALVARVHFKCEECENSGRLMDSADLLREVGLNCAALKYN